MDQYPGTRLAPFPITQRPLEPSNVPITSHTDIPAVSKPNKPAKEPSTRRALSCLPCRRHKLKCDRRVPCHSCIRYRREELCRKHPAPSSLLDGMRGAPRAPTNAIAAVSDPSSFGHIAPSYNGAQNHPAMPVAPSSLPLPSAPARSPLPDTSLTVGNTLEMKGPANQPSDTTQKLAGTSVLPRSLPVLLSAGQNPARQADVALFWKTQLTSFLPTKGQCDLLITYYIDHINWVHHVVHPPSFHEEYAAFWDTKVQDVNLIWLSYFYAILCCSAIYLPLDVARSVGFPGHSLRSKSHEWYSSSRQALHAGGFESRPSLTQLLTFLVTQIYWLATKNIEVMNSALGQAVRNAQALGLDRDVTGKNHLDTELRRRIWWELFNCDVFQSMCLGRAPLISTNPMKVPFPAHCNDDEISETMIDAKPMEQPTDASGNIIRAEVFLIFRKLYDSDNDPLSSYEIVKSVDDQIEELLSQMPWYFQHLTDREYPAISEGLENITWQYHIIHSCICMQRIRMNRPFIHTRTGNSWDVCARAANDVLAAYRKMRNRNVDEFRRSAKLHIQAYQTFSAAVSLAGFLLVERSFPADNIRKDIEMVIADLEFTDASIAADGRKVLLKMLEMHDRRDLREPLDPEALVSEISLVFGGEQTTRKYFKRCDIGYVLNDDSGPSTALQSTIAPIPGTIDLNGSQQNLLSPQQLGLASMAASVPQLPDYMDTFYSLNPPIDFGFDDGIMQTVEWELMNNMTYHHP